jgi:dihydropteroate synthase
MLINLDNTFHVMGILNVTSDSFSDGGLFQDKHKALAHARAMLKEGATIIDVGGESSRPGADEVSIDEELDRVIPVIESLSQGSDVLISIDTTKPKVMSEAIRAGAKMLNDVNALQAEGAIAIAAQHDVDVCLMHRQGTPQNMQAAPDYNDVLTDVGDFLGERIEACLTSGIDPSHICVDPGFGFGKKLEHNLTLIKYLDSFSVLGYPILIGVSRKSSLGILLNKDEMNRLPGSLALTVMAYLNGARLFRTHDVKETVDALKVAEAVCKQAQVLL